jgi:HEPN domain-containing protein
LYKKEYSLQLLQVAERDLVSATILRDHGGSPEVILFHLQQVVEKVLKAVMIHKGEQVPFNHNLDSLLMILPDHVCPPHTEIFSDLTPYATHLRYEQGQAILAKADLDFYCSMVQEVYSWGQGALKK